MNRYARWLSAPLAVLAFAGCGGDGPGTTPPIPPPPAPAPPPPPPPPEPPGKPTGIRVAEVGHDFVLWTWDPVEGATSYLVSASPAFPRGPSPEITVEAPVFRFDGLEPGADYWIYVRAVRETAGGRAEGPLSDRGVGSTLALIPDPPTLMPLCDGTFPNVVLYTRVPDAVRYVFEGRNGSDGEWWLTAWKTEPHELWGEAPDGTPIYVFEEDFTIRPLGIRVWYRVRALMNSGEYTDWSEPAKCPGREPESGEPPADPRFDLRFWNELAFDTRDCPADSCGSPIEARNLWVLDTTNPNFHIVTTGFRESEVSAMRSMIPEVVATLTGKPYRGEITTGTDAVEDFWWISVEAVEGDEGGACGRARVGSVFGRITINVEQTSLPGRDGCDLRGLFPHEVGHALGFYHVADRRAVMSYVGNSDTVHRFTRAERYHAQLAYELGRLTPYGRYTPYSANNTTATAEGRPIEAVTTEVTCRLH